MEQLILHLVGDYLLQSDWMAQEKRRSSWAAAAHALTYSLPFVALLAPSPRAFLVICGTHFLIDRFGLARYVAWTKNWLAPPGWMRMPWRQCTATGYPPDRPVWLSTWLTIIADNTLHLICNYVALRWL